MSYTPDYGRAIDSIVTSLSSKSPDEWGLIALAGIGFWFVGMLVIIVLEALKDHCQHTQGDQPAPESPEPTES